MAASVMGAAPDPAGASPVAGVHELAGGLARAAFGLGDAHGVGAHSVSAPRAALSGASSASGRPLDPGARRFMEGRFGRPMDTVRIHAGPAAGVLAEQINARAFTTGENVFFAPGQYQPDSETGRRLLAHELTHVVQQRSGADTSLADAAAGVPVEHVPGAGRLHRQLEPFPSIGSADTAAEREYGGSGAPSAKTCSLPAEAPAGFCSPYRSQKLAEYYRAKNSGWIMAGISAAVDSRVVPLWSDYLSGGSPPRDLSGTFATDFTASPTTLKVTKFLRSELQAQLTAAPPFVSRSSRVSLGIETLVPRALAALADPTSHDQMNFNLPSDIAGNLAGGIGLDQTACPSGAQPSPFNDDRRAQGTVELVRGTGPDVVVIPSITYTVQDTIDLCPGNWGSLLETVATVPLSQFEATGISGDVPFTVQFPAPAPGLLPFTIAAPSGPDPAPAPAPVPTPAPVPPPASTLAP